MQNCGVRLLPLDFRDQYFGCEIELTGINRATAARTLADLFGTRAEHSGGGYDAYRVKDLDGKEWKIVRDGSIHPESRRRSVLIGETYKVELNSPKLEYGEMEKLQEVVRALRRAGGIVNDSCGMHVHVDASKHTPQMFREVQAEIARRNSKSCANQRKKKRGRYNSKYALSERLYCGECGSPYKRVTWNIHGRKEIVWRCVNRVTYGTKFCHNSPSVQEEVLHRILLRAIQNLADNYTEEVSMQINGILHDLQGGTTELEKLQQKLADARQEFDRLLDISLECDASFLDEKLKHASEEIDTLQKQIDQLTASQQKAANPDLQLTDSDFRITEYSDTLVARIIERIDIVSANEIKIEFIGGYTVTAPLRS
ncbi:amidoligase family protein [bacterium]|nr:amidoligase family protein [bacterium]